MVRGMRALLGVCLFVVLGLIALSTLSSGPPTTTALQSLVTQTHHQLNQLHKLKEEFGGDQPLDNTVLTTLGFIESPFIFPNHSWSNVSTPVIVSAVTSRLLGLVPDLIKVAQVLSVNASLVIYTLDLTENEIKEVQDECNETCFLIQFEFSKYPSHVRDVRLGAYRSIIIQEMLERSGIVFWLDPCMQILQNASLKRGRSEEGSLLEVWTQRALKVGGGVLTWPLMSPAPHLPTSALTHPDMFPAFRTFKHNYDFQQMSDPKAVLVVNSAFIHRRLMRPWVRCSLTPSCLTPIGAQDTGCKYNKKPLFRYSGCHLYDASAFNVALGLAYGMDNDSYLDLSLKLVCVKRSFWQSTGIGGEPFLMTLGSSAVAATAGGSGGGGGGGGFSYSKVSRRPPPPPPVQGQFHRRLQGAKQRVLENKKNRRSPPQQLERTLSATNNSRGPEGVAVSSNGRSSRVSGSLPSRPKLLR